MQTRSSKVLSRGPLTLKDRPSRMKLSEAAKLLGPNGRKLIPRYAKTWDFQHAFRGQSSLHFTTGRHSKKQFNWARLH